MSAWLRAQWAEMLKLKGTFGLWLVLLMPLAVAVLVSLLTGLAVHQAKTSPDLSPAEAWLNLGDSFFVLWGGLMVPLFVTLQAAWLAGLEYGNDQWKHLLALPLPRGTHYVVKLTTVVAMLLCAYLFLLALITPAGWILMIAAPKTGLAGSPRLGQLLVPAACSFAASLLLVTLQTWVALRWCGFSAAVSVGVVGTIAGVLLTQFTYSRYFPWSMPVQAFTAHGQYATFTALLGVVGALVVGALGLYDFLHRDSI